MTYNQTISSWCTSDNEEFCEAAPDSNLVVPNLKFPFAKWTYERLLLCWNPMEQPLIVTYISLFEEYMEQVVLHHPMQDSFDWYTKSFKAIKSGTARCLIRITWLVFCDVSNLLKILLEVFSQMLVHWAILAFLSSYFHCRYNFLLDGVDNSTFAACYITINYLHLYACVCVCVSVCVWVRVREYTIITNIHTPTTFYWIETNALWFLNLLFTFINETTENRFTLTLF